MGKKAKKAKKDEGKRGFKANSKEGRFLAKLLKTGKVSAGITPGAIKELHPMFDDFKSDSFAAGLRRMKTKYGCNVRGGTGMSIDWIGLDCHKRLFGMSYLHLLLSFHH